MSETLGNRMSKKLKEYGISQRLLATLTHTTEVSVSRYVNDKRIPKADVLYRIACALHTTTDYLLGLTTSEQTNEEFLRSATFEELAGAIYEWYSKGHIEGKVGKQLSSVTRVVEWLKEKHNGNI